ncbi:SH3 domain-containing protein [Pseudobutyrivibrio sp. 49]|uniref:SH3 domain-containing protein n=1 Tax=unclassified Pseudobutyrivibrio TaxID=2638619 RepID=UPI00087FFFEE|nr:MULTISPECIES: SH3 domain-containing protein [unclassified Pseudobutyrivibrio]SDH30578.1 SH3 domain-containing protein [Pseudobutyrivibrio sp. 49]SFN49750.1 SH3 domain-containing protein [Pseudobutyrivibrio sp. UC1225]
MDFQKLKDKIRYIAGICGDFIALHKRYFLAGCIFICMAFVLFMGTGKSATQDKSVEGVYKNYKENKNEELNKLISDYYVAYAAGDTDSLKKIADPVSDQEVSYIQFYSQYIDSFNNIKVFTKDGLENGSYLCSVRVDLKYKDIDTQAPGLDFFYVETNDDGKLFINNIYGSFNQTNNIYEMDTEISDLISVFIRQQDKLDKEAEVTEAYEDAIDKDASLATFMSETLPAAIVQWNSDYQVQVAAAAEEAAKAEEEAKAKAEEDAKAAEEAAKAAEEEANSYTATTSAKANVREQADKNSNRLGSIQKGVEITVYGEEGDFYKFDYNGTKAYITKDAVKLSDGNDTAEETQETQEETPAAKTLNKGDKITIKSTTNIRSSMDTSSSKVAVAYDGDEVEVIQSYAEGWTKVKFKKKEGYIRTDLLSK